MLSARPSRVFLVDDHPLVREWLTALIHRQDNLLVCGEAQTIAEAARGIAKTGPDVAIVDLSLQDGSGLDLIKTLALRHPDTRVIVLSMHDETIYAERALRAGARGYIMKRETAKTIVTAIRQVMNGKLHVSPALQALFAERFVGGSPTTAQSPIERLSDRELEVFRLLGEGLKTRQVAAFTGLGVKTVHSYYARIREKLGLADASELLREAISWNRRHAQV